MNARRLISLVVIVSLLAGCINSMRLISSRAARLRTLMLVQSEGTDRGRISVPDHHHGIFDAALVSTPQGVLPAPAAIFCMLAPALAADPVIHRTSFQASGSSPPYMAAEQRQTYLRISVLRI